MVAHTAHQAPYLLSIGERAEAIVQAYQLRQQATQEALAALEELIREINQAEQERAEKNLETRRVCRVLAAEAGRIR